MYVSTARIESGRSISDREEAIYALYQAYWGLDDCYRADLNVARGSCSGLGTCAGCLWQGSILWSTQTPLDPRFLVAGGVTHGPGRI